MRTTRRAARDIEIPVWFDASRAGGEKNALGSRLRTARGGLHGRKRYLIEQIPAVA